VCTTHRLHLLGWKICRRQGIFTDVRNSIGIDDRGAVHQLSRYSVANASIQLVLHLLVQLHVSLHRVEPDKLLAAQPALVRLLARVLPRVDGEVRPRREVFAALLAAERLLAGVRPHVNGQRRRHAERPAAQDALVPLLTAVRQKMLPHIHHRLAADRARRPAI